jgi:hydrogenase maturation factor
MCLSIPGKVIEISNDKYIIDYGTEKLKVNRSLIDVKLGDYVIVSNKIIISRLKKGEAKEFFEIIISNNDR